MLFPLHAFERPVEALQRLLLLLRRELLDALEHLFAELLGRHALGEAAPLAALAPAAFRVIAPVCFGAALAAEFAAFDRFLLAALCF